MARIVLASFLIRYPVGGYQSWILQWLVGLQRLGHDVYFVEKAGWNNACFNLRSGENGNDPSDAIDTVVALLARFGLEHHWCFVSHDGAYHGMTKSKVDEVFASADLFIDTMQLCEWQEEGTTSATRVLVDGEPGYRQMRIEQREAKGGRVFPFDHYFTVGRNVGTPRSTVPTAGRTWKPIFDPVVVDLFPVSPPPAGAPWTTVMSWQSHQPLEHAGVVYGQKDVEFEKFVSLPSQVPVGLELAIAGKHTPQQRLRAEGWHLRDSHEVTLTFDAWRSYIASSRGEFSVAKNVFVQTNSGFFSDRSAAYLASGRPVVLQETGFSAHLPCGAGLFAVTNVAEAADAIKEVEANYEYHSRMARQIAHEYLDTEKVLGRFLGEIGI